MTEMTETTTQFIEETPEKSNGEFKAPTTQAELDRIIECRLNRERSKFSNYEEYKASHEKLMQIEGTEKPELSKWQQRFDKADTASTLANRADVLLKEIIHESSTNQLSRNNTNEFSYEKENKELYQIVVNIVTTY